MLGHIDYMFTYGTLRSLFISILAIRNIFSLVKYVILNHNGIAILCGDPNSI